MEWLIIFLAGWIGANVLIVAYLAVMRRPNGAPSRRRPGAADDPPGTSRRAAL